MLCYAASQHHHRAGDAASARVDVVVERRDLVLGQRVRVDAGIVHEQAAAAAVTDTVRGCVVREAVGPLRILQYTIQIDVNLPKVIDADDVVPHPVVDQAPGELRVPVPVAAAVAAGQYAERDDSTVRPVVK